MPAIQVQTLTVDELEKLDLNLLVVFDAVMAEGSVKLAAERLKMKPPAVSQALGRLRESVGAELFVRTGSGLRPTPMAVGMWDGIRRALELIKSSVTGTNNFDPATARRVITLDLPSGADALIMPGLARRVANAPGLTFRVASARAFNVLNDLRFGESWLALDYRPVNEPGYRCETISEQDVVAIAARGHPQLKDGLTRELYQSLPQVAVASARTTSVLPVTERLDAAGLVRNVRYMVPGLLSATRMVAELGLIASLPLCTARFCTSLADVEVHRLPFRIDRMQFYQVWHERFDDDPAHLWLRETMHEICGEL